MASRTPPKRDYYEVLGVAKDATRPQIRKAYFRQSRIKHPDKGGSPGEFQELQQAYEVLQDGNKRALYDQYGHAAADMLNAGQQMNPAQFMAVMEHLTQKQRNILCSVICFVFLFASAIPALIAMKIDGGLDWAWHSALAPLWVVDALVLCAVFGVLTKGTESVLQRLSTSVSLLLFVLIQIFIVLKLEGAVQWSWLVTFLPWLLYELHALMVTLLGSAVQKEYIQLWQIRSMDGAAWSVSCRVRACVRACLRACAAAIGVVCVGKLTTRVSLAHPLNSPDDEHGRMTDREQVRKDPRYWLLFIPTFLSTCGRLGFALCLAFKVSQAVRQSVTRMCLS